MKISDIMRDIADLIDQKMGQEPSGDPAAGNATQTRMSTVDVAEPEDVDANTMVPPLQAKLELLKKSEGVPNVYDDEDTDELTVIRKNAGITTAQQEASDDEPLDY
jgi:hypothetical protein